MEKKTNSDSWIIGSLLYLFLVRMFFTLVYKPTWLGSSILILFYFASPFAFYLLVLGFFKSIKLQNIVSDQIPVDTN